METLTAKKRRPVSAAIRSRICSPLMISGPGRSNQALCSSGKSAADTSASTTSSSATGQVRELSHLGRTMNGKRTAKSRTICQDALPKPITIEARSSSARTRPARNDALESSDQWLGPIQIAGAPSHARRARWPLLTAHRHDLTTATNERGHERPTDEAGRSGHQHRSVVALGRSHLLSLARTAAMPKTSARAFYENERPFGHSHRAQILRGPSLCARNSERAALLSSDGAPLLAASHRLSTMPSIQRV